jgi:hypothetical protein
VKVFLLLKRPRDVFEKVSRRERDRRGVREVPRLRASRRLSIGEAKARLRRFVENPNKKKKRRGTRAPRCAYEYLGELLHGVPGSVSRVHHVSFSIRWLSLSLHLATIEDAVFFYVCVSFFLRSVVIFQHEKKKKEFSLCFVALRLW